MDAVSGFRRDVTENSRMHWLLQNNILNEDGHSRLVHTLETLGIPHSVHKIIPFTCDLFPKPEITEKKVVCFGSYAVLRVALANAWTPGVFALKEFTHEEMAHHWGEHMLNARGRQTAFQNVPQTPEFQKDGFFLRPATDEKFFAGMTTDTTEFQEWWHQVVTQKTDFGTGLTPKTPVLIAPLQKIHSEYRTWILNGRVVTASSYKLNGTLHVNLPIDDDIVNFANARTQEWNPSVAYCLDVARTPNGLRIVEINTINFAGFYNSNVAKIVEELENLVR